MPIPNNPQEFVDRAKENNLSITAEDAAGLGVFADNVSSTYEAIREIDTTGFEPAAIFVPTPSKRESN
ncbi:hypothetical protein [Candidatus Lucifugimonas marina]|uniref:Uncharacterized protein n=1 Tax=Candidatus Lucifugimonas marina TaxID=3038979 RepID=A0AAJ5ZEZ5_9CHLR|nr:hypothetical protein [SAR202 cluster bacterium JH702]MDG0870150.1 hypothetical protein [SAR202 cluster bacterium JH639]WFG36294.1 hypothetical protein GKN94_11550 [SAR202 cluster bacterium JH545]WFG40227.1 hypothetical protein GKO48_11585 [SAR202 cluster bacterium JH1073]